MAKQSSDFIFELIDAPGIAPMPIKVRKLLKAMARHHGLRVRFPSAADPAAGAGSRRANEAAISGSAGPLISDARAPESTPTPTRKRHRDSATAACSGRNETIPTTSQARRTQTHRQTGLTTHQSYQQRQNDRNEIVSFPLLTPATPISKATVQ